MQNDDEDPIPEDNTPVRHLRCYCGKKRMETSQKGNLPNCIGCEECNSTMAESVAMCKQVEAHTWDKVNNERQCTTCGTRELSDTHIREYATIHRRYDGKWINSSGEIMALLLVKKYNIKGRYLRNGIFDPRDDIRSLLINE